MESHNGKIYVQSNRPTSLLLFFQNILLERDHDDSTVYIVIDPDFIFRKPLPEDAFDLVRDGTFLTQAYGLENPANYAHKCCLEAASIAAGADKAAVDARECERLVGVKSYRDFFGGVPYMLQAKDWIKLLHWWIPLIGPVLKHYPGIESDMISWAIAAKLAGLTGTRKEGYMATCMSSESVSVTVLEEQVWLHLCQSYYVPETRGPAYEVNPTSELAHITSSSYPKDRHGYLYVFNKHWLKNSRLLEDCTVPLLVSPPPLPTSELSNKHLWFHFVCREAVQAFNTAVLEFRAKYPCPNPAQQPQSNQGLILHEIHRARYGGGWSHIIDL